MQVRQLELTDYYKGFFELLNHLSAANQLPFQQFEQILKNYPGVIVVGEVDGKIVSTASLVYEVNKFETIAHIENVVTLPEYRGQGFAKLVLQDLIQRSNNIDLYCKRENAAFYEKLGFKIEGEMFAKYL